MKSLFTDDETYSDAARDLDDRIRDAIHPIINEFSGKGYSVRDIEYVIKHAVITVCLGRIVKNRIFNKKEIE